MEKKQYNAPAIEMMRVHAEAVLAAASPAIGLSDDEEATEDACSKFNDFDDFDDDEYSDPVWQ